MAQDNIKPRGRKQRRKSALDFAVEGRDQATLDMVRASVEHDNTCLAFQPVIATLHNAQPAFYEGLIRVQDETGRIIPAKDFMPLVEDTELGRKIDCAALKLGLSTLARNPHLRLAINMSARSIGYRPWMRVLERALAKDFTLGERLILEITETSAMHVPDVVIGFMSGLQKKGICFALDDFGSGHTAIRYFKDFYFDIVKIDGRFIRGIASNPDNEVVTRALCAIAHQFDMLTVAENVEQAADVAMLTEIGVDCLQGYYFGAPTVQPPWETPTAQLRKA